MAMTTLEVGQIISSQGLCSSQYSSEKGQVGTALNALAPPPPLFGSCTSSPTAIYCEVHGS